MCIAVDTVLESYYQAPEGLRRTGSAYRVLSIGVRKVRVRVIRGEFMGQTMTLDRDQVPNQYLRVA